MSKIDKQYWEYYVKTRELSSEEQADEELCAALRKTLDYAGCCMWVALGNLFDEILLTFGGKK